MYSQDNEKKEPFLSLPNKEHSHGHGHSHGDLTSFERTENLHADVANSGLRPMVFGFSDGLVTNMCLILGVYFSSGDVHHKVVVLTGIAGMLAGAFSMAIGEWISMKIQQEAEENQLALEFEHMERFPDAEEKHFRRLLMANGLTEHCCDLFINDILQTSIHQRVK